MRGAGILYRGEREDKGPTVTTGSSVRECECERVSMIQHSVRFCDWFFTICRARLGIGWGIILALGLSFDSFPRSHEPTLHCLHLGRKGIVLFRGYRFVMRRVLGVKVVGFLQAFGSLCGVPLQHTIIPCSLKELQCGLGVQLSSSIVLECITNSGVCDNDDGKPKDLGNKSNHLVCEV